MGHVQSTCLFHTKPDSQNHLIVAHFHAQTLTTSKSVLQGRLNSIGRQNGAKNTYVTPAASSDSAYEKMDCTVCTYR